MRSKALFLIFILIFFIVGGINAKFGFGRSSGRSSGYSRGSSRSSSRGSSHGRTSSGTSHGGTSFGMSHGGSSSNQKIGSYGSSSSKPASTHLPGQKFGSSTSAQGSSSHPRGSNSGSIASEKSKNINAQFLNAEGGGATRPAQTKPVQPPYPTNLHPTAPVAGSTTGWKPGVTTESKQTSPFQPSAPHETLMKSSAGTLHNQGHQATGPTNPPWSNPYLGNNRPATPAQSHPPWHNPNSGLNRTVGLSPSWSNPYLGNSKPPISNSQPIAPGSYPPSIGFKDHVYPQSYPTSAGSPFNPSMSRYPSYPTQPMPSNNAWSTHSAYPPLHQTNSMPLGNPYSMHPPGGAAYNTPGQPYYPQQPHVLAQPAVQPFVPGQTILMVPGQQSSGPGLGQMIKEALVFSTINAGVNRILNPHSHTHYIESKPAAAPTTTTHITYNNQYFNTPPGVNGTTNPTNVPQAGPTNNYPNEGFPSNMAGPPSGNLVGSPPGNVNSYAPYTPSSGVQGSTTAGNGNGTPITGSRATNNVIASTTTTNVSSNQNGTLNDPVSVDNTLLYRISDDELLKISEELFARTPKDLFKGIKLNLQTRVTSVNVTDEAKEPLFDVAPELMEYPTIYVTRSLYDRYEYDFRKKLNRTLETRKQENLLIDTFLNTNTMQWAMQWLADRGFIDPDDFERKDVLRRIWFTMFSGSTCGFERVFASENYGTAIVGVQDWMYFQDQESRKRIDYMGYVDKLDIGNTASLVKLNFQMDGIVRPNATIFVGTTPELEMSLYTICFFTRPNNLCPVSLAGTKFNIYTHSFIYFGSEVMDLGLPMF